MIPLIFKFRSSKLNKLLLKVEYSVLMMVFSLLSLVFLLVLTPLFYMKTLLNSIFIYFNNPYEEYKNENLLMLLRTMFLGVPMIMVSILIDFMQLPFILFRPKCSFEHKYEKSVDRMTDE